MFSMKITVAGVEYEAHAFNCAIFKFPPEYAMHDHIFIALPEDEGGIYVFGDEKSMAVLAGTGQFPIHYLPYVPDPDIAAYRRYREEVAKDRDSEVEAEQPISEEEIERFMQAAEKDGVIGHWDELEGE